MTCDLSEHILARGFTQALVCRTVVKVFLNECPELLLLIPHFFLIKLLFDCFMLLESIE